MSVKKKKQASVQTVSGSTPTQGNPALQKALALVQKNDYLAAANLLASAGREVQVRNALGVCLMRLGKVDQAVEIFRSFVLVPGAVVERPELSNACKRNFATALLMKGLPSGALSVLAETRDREHVMAVRLHSAIKRWEMSLSWFRRLDWKINRCEPPMCHVPLDFEPGEFDIEVQRSRSVPPVKPHMRTPKLAA